MTIRHPYTFVPFPDEKMLDRQPWPAMGPVGHERFVPGSLSGTLECVLSTVTPLCIKSHFGELHRKGEAPFVPGSSLKGMLRNTMQMLGFGCAGQQFKKSVKKEREEELTTPKLQLGYMSSCGKDSACLVCRIFGYAVEEAGAVGKDTGGEKEPFGWAAKVRIHDSDMPSDWSDERWVQMNHLACTVDGHPPARPQDQGARHLAFYFPFGDGRPAGWKIHRHASRITRIDDRHASNTCVKAGTKFGFRLEFENLTPHEYAVLEFCLTLTHKCSDHPSTVAGSLVHKLGYGKGVGMGSCRLEIARPESLDVRRYFGRTALTAGGHGCSLGALLTSNAFQSFRDARTSAGGAVVLAFPTRDEFTTNPDKSIDDYDSYLAREKPTVTCPQPPVTAPLPKPLADSLPKTVRCRITSTKGNMLKGETMNAYNGAKYRFQIPTHQGSGNYNATEIDVTVDPKIVDHVAHTFRAVRWQS